MLVLLELHTRVRQLLQYPAVADLLQLSQQQQLNNEFPRQHPLYTFRASNSRIFLEQLNIIVVDDCGVVRAQLRQRRIYWNGLRHTCRCMAEFVHYR
jgi:hypothetical protein